MLERLKRALSPTIDRLQEKFPPNRLVALLTPTVFAPAAAYLTAWAATHLPGLPAFSTGEVTGFFVAGALIAGAKAYKWLDGWQKAEEREAFLEDSETQRRFENHQARRKALVDIGMYDADEDPATP